METEKKEKAQESPTNSKFSAFIAKIRTIKHIEIIIAAVAIAVMILIYVGGSALGNRSQTPPQSTNEISSPHAKQSELETRLAALLSQVAGVGKVEVLIIYSTTSEKVLAETVSRNSGTSGSTETRTPVLVNRSGQSEPVIVKEILPEVRGVLIVAQGAGSPVIRLELMRAAQTILGITANNIEIFAMR
jgi:stage III sporulation protein AG